MLLNLSLLYPEAARTAEFHCQNHPVIGYSSWAAKADSTKINESHSSNEKTFGCVILVRLSEMFHNVFSKIANDLFAYMHNAYKL